MKRLLSAIHRGLPLQLFVSVVSFLILYSRRPDAVENPQFWAEDIVWYKDAYNLVFFNALLKPNAGYLQTLSRLVAAISQLFPLGYAPFIFNAAGFVVEIGIVNFLVSKRFSKTVPNLAISLLLGLISLTIPHSGEAHINLTNSQWHLAILSFLVLISHPEDKISWKIFDIVVVAISAATGPFCVFLLPVAVVMYWKRREKWTVILGLILTIVSILQIYYVIQTRKPAASHANSSAVDLVSIVCGQIFFSGIFGKANFIELISSEWRYQVLVIIGVISIGLIIYCLVKAQLELKLFIIYAAAILFSTIVYGEWEPLSYPPYGERYWLIPITCYLAVLIYAAAVSKNLLIKSVGIILLALSSIGIYSDWQYQPYVDFHFQQFAQEFEAAPSGTTLKTQVNPEWEFSLTKK